MTVSELIALLETCPLESEVVFDRAGTIETLYDKICVDDTNSDDNLTWLTIDRN